MNKRIPIQLRQDDVLFFLHIPKTESFSLIAYLDAQFSPEEIFPLHSGTTHDFDRYTPEQLARIRLVRGHFRFGPLDGKIYRHLTPNPLRITFLRDPIERTISAYQHMLRKPEAPLHREVNRRGLSLLDFVSDPAYAHRVRDKQTALVVGACNPAVAPLSENTMLTLAKERLEQFAFVGLTEQFEPSLQGLARTFGWPKPETRPVHAPALAQDKLTKDEMSAITKQVRLDLELYRFAQTLFKKRSFHLLWYFLLDNLDVVFDGLDFAAA